MANKRISELNNASTLQNEDLIAVVQDTGTENETRKTTVGALRSGMSAAQTITSNDGSITVNQQGNTVDLSRDFYVQESVFSFHNNSCCALKLIEITTHSNSKGAFTFDVSSWGMPHLCPYYGEFFIDLFLNSLDSSKFRYMYFGSESFGSDRIFPSDFVLIRTSSTTAELWKKRSFSMEENSLLGIKLCDASLNVIQKPQLQENANFSELQDFNDYVANYTQITLSAFTNISR